MSSIGPGSRLIEGSGIAGAHSDHQIKSGKHEDGKNQVLRFSRESARSKQEGDFSFGGVGLVRSTSGGPTRYYNWNQNESRSTTETIGSSAENLCRLLRGEFPPMCSPSCTPTLIAKSTGLLQTAEQIALAWHHR